MFKLFSCTLMWYNRGEQVQNNLYCQEPQRKNFGALEGRRQIMIWTLENQVSKIENKTYLTSPLLLFLNIVAVRSVSDCNKLQNC